MFETGRRVITGKTDEDSNSFEQQASTIVKAFNAGNVEFARLGRVGNTMARLAIERDTPTLANMNGEAKMNAEFVEMSDLRHKTGNFKASKARLAKLYPDWQIDTSLSTDNAMVINKIGTREAVVSFRGTNLNNKIKSGFMKGMPEPFAWGGILSGTEDKFDYFKSADKTLKRAINKYTINELTGFSMGGTLGIKLGDKYNIPSKTFNPFLGKNILSGKPINKGLVHNITRTTNDIATAGLVLAKSKHNLSIDSIDPIKQDLNKIQSVEDLNAPRNTPKRFNEIVRLATQVESHGLHNFTEDGDRQNAMDLVTENAQRASAKAGDAGLIMTANKLVRNSGTFTEFVDAINANGDEFGGTDTKFDENGNRVLTGKRMHRNATINKIWEQELGKTGRVPYTPSEERYINSLDVVESRPISTFSEEEYKNLRSKISPQREKDINEKYINKIAQSFEPELPNIKYSNNIGTSIARNLTNVGRVGTGIAGSVIGGQAASAGLAAIGVDLDNLQPEVRALVEGGAGGAVTEAGLAYLYGRSFLPKATNVLKGGLGGAVGAVAQEATSRGIKELLNLAGVEENASNIVSESVGGAVGGGISVASLPVVSGVASAFSNEIAIMAGLEVIEASAEIGSFGGAAGLVAGAVIGSAVAGGIAIYQAFQPKEDYVLSPDRASRPDQIIGADALVQELIAGFNEEADFSPEAILAMESAIEARANELEAEGVFRMPLEADGSRIKYNFNAKLTPIGRGASSLIKSDVDGSSVMLPAEYPQNYINTGRHSVREQLAIRAELRQGTHTKDLKTYIQNLSKEEKDIIMSLDDVIDIESLTNENISEILGYENQDPNYEPILTEPVLPAHHVSGAIDKKDQYYTDLASQQRADEEATPQPLLP